MRFCARTVTFSHTAFENVHKWRPQFFDDPYSSVCHYLLSNFPLPQTDVIKYDSYCHLPFSNPSNKSVTHQVCKKPLGERLTKMAWDNLGIHGRFLINVVSHPLFSHRFTNSLCHLTQTDDGDLHFISHGSTIHSGKGISVEIKCTLSTEMPCRLR